MFTQINIAADAEKMFDLLNEEFVPLELHVKDKRGEH